MANQNALRDDNWVATLLGVSSSNSAETAAAAVDPATNRLLVNATISGGGAGGTSSTDDSAFTAGSGSGTPLMGFVTSDSVDAGDVGVIGMLANRQLKVTLYDSGGAELSVGGGTQYTEDAAAAANPIGNALNLIRDDARSGSITSTDGDNIAARGTNAGELYVKHVDAVSVTSSTATGSAVPANAHYIGINGGGNLTGLAGSADNADGAAASSTASRGLFVARQTLFNGSTWDRIRSVVNATNSTGTGIVAAGVLAQFDDTSPTSITENQFGNLRMSANRNLYGTIRDAAGNERGVNVTAGNALVVDGSAVTQPVSATSVTPGTSATSLGKAEDAAHSSGDTGVMSLGVRVDTPATALSGTDGDYTPIATSSTGAVRNAPMSEDFAALANGPQVKKYYTNAGAVTDGIVWSPAAGKRWYVTDIFINVSAAATVTLEDDKAAGDETVWKAELAANSGWSHSFETPLFSGEDAADLLVTTTAGNVYITATGYEV